MHECLQKWEESTVADTNNNYQNNVYTRPQTILRVLVFARSKYAHTRKITFYPGDTNNYYL